MLCCAMVQVWTRVFSQVCFALLLLQLIMMGILGECPQLRMLFAPLC